MPPTAPRHAAILLAACLTPGLAGSAAAFADDKPATAPEPGKAEVAAQAPPGSSGQISIEKEVLDVGDVIRGQMLTAVFTVRNTGKDVLKILEAKPG